MGLHNSLDVRNYLTSNIDDSVNSIDAHRSYDASGMGPGNDFSEDINDKIEDIDEEINMGGVGLKEHHNYQTILKFL